MGVERNQYEGATVDAAGERRQRNKMQTALTVHEHHACKCAASLI